jgi:hypothetical protein
VAAALADAAVGRDRLARIEALLLDVELPQLVDALERAVFRVDGLGPRHALGARDVAAAQRAFVRIVGHVQALAAVLVRATHVDQLALLLDDLLHVVAERADGLVVALGRLVAAGGEGRRLAGELAAFLLPLQAAAVQDLGLGMAEQLEHPERVGGPPVVLVAVEDDGRVRGGADLRHQGFEAFARDVVAANLVVQVGGPVDVRGAGNVPGCVQQRVFVRLDDADVLVLQMRGEPLGAHEDIRLRIGGCGGSAHPRSIGGAHRVRAAVRRSRPNSSVDPPSHRPCSRSPGS